METIDLNTLKHRMRFLAIQFQQTYNAYDIYSLAESVGAKLTFIDLGNKDGAYDPEHHLIILNPNRDLKRQKFTLAHEIAHILVLGDDEILSDLHDAYTGSQLEFVLEELCNYGAAHILIPDKTLEELALKHGYSATAALELSRLQDISAQSAMIALAEAATEAVIFAIVAPAAFGKPLTIQFSTKSESFKYSLGQGIVIPSEHDVSTSYETGLPLANKSYIPFASQRKVPCWLTTYPEKTRVLCSFTLGHPNLKASNPEPKGSQDLL